MILMTQIGTPLTKFYRFTFNTQKKSNISKAQSPENNQSSREHLLGTLSAILFLTLPTEEELQTIGIEDY